MTIATWTGEVLVNGTPLGKRGTLIATPAAEGTWVVSDDHIAYGSAKAETDGSGVIQGGLDVEDVPGLLYTLTWEPHDNSGDVNLGVFDMSGGGDIAADLTSTIPTAVDESVRLDIAAAAALGATNDTATASFVSNPASATTAALAGTYTSRTSRARHDVARGLYFPEAEGAVGNGTTNDRTAIQAAITTASAAKGTVVFSPGVTYACASPLVAVDNVTLYLSPGSKILRNTSHTGAFIANTSYSTKINKFRITGPGTIGSTSTAITGQVVFIWGDDLELSDFTIDTYAGGQAILIGGDRNRMRAVKCINPDPVAGVGGIRMYGGTDFVATACHVICGDDALQFTPIATAGHPLVNLSINKAVYVSCTGGSAAARFMIAALSTSPPGSGGLTNSITNSGWIGCHGYGRNRGLVITNTDSTGEIANVYSTDCSLDMTGATAQLQDVLINRTAAMGRVRKIDLTRLRVVAPAAAAVGTTGSATTSVYVEDVTLTDCQLEAPASGVATVKPLGVDGFTIRGGRLDGVGTAHVIEGGTGVNASRNVTIDGPKITGVGNTFAAVRLPESVGFKIEGIAPAILAGATTSTGVSLTASSSRGRIAGNDFTDLGGAGVTGTVPTGTILQNNRAYVSRGFGTDTISAASTTKAVTHGMATTPTSITVTGAANEVLYVTAKNATTFTVSRNASGVAHTFNWSADYQP